MWEDPANRLQDVEQALLTASLGKRMSRRTLLKTGAGLAVTGAGVGALFGLHAGTGTTFASPTSTPNAAIQWNNAALQAIRDTNPGPTIAARALAIMHTCMYDAWATYTSISNPTRPNRSE